MNLNGILIGSDNPERLVAYYTKLFGAPGWSEFEETGIRPRYKNPLDVVWWLPRALVPWGSAPR